MHAHAAGLRGCRGRPNTAASDHRRAARTSRAALSRPAIVDRDGVPAQDQRGRNLLEVSVGSIRARIGALVERGRVVGAKVFIRDLEGSRYPAEPIAGCIPAPLGTELGVIGPIRCGHSPLPRAACPGIVSRRLGVRAAREAM
jgi:hypothetical protein